MRRNPAIARTNSSSRKAMYSIPDATSLGNLVAEFNDTKHRLIEATIELDDLEGARDTFVLLHRKIRCIRDEIQQQLDEGTLDEMPPETAKSLVDFLHVLDVELLSDDPELPN